MTDASAQPSTSHIPTPEELDFDLDGGIAAGIEDLASDDVDDRGHGAVGRHAGIDPAFEGEDHDRR